MANQYFVFREMPALNEVFPIEDETAAHHIFTVMRAQAGQSLQLVFTGGKIGLAQVVSPEAHTVKLQEILSAVTELPIEVTVLVGFPKGDKLDFIAEKATELGAAAIWAAPFAWSVAKWEPKKLAKKQEKLQKIVRNAGEQSRRQILPEIQLFDRLSAVTEKFAAFDAVAVAYEESAKAGERSAFAQILGKLQAGQKLLLIFGPEGGISPEEIELFTTLGGQCVGLGPRILRAETAPLYALSALSTYFELLQD